MDATAFDSIARRLKLPLILSFCLLGFFAAELSYGITLKDACVETLNHSNLVKASKENILGAESRVKSVLAEQWPSINLISDIGVSRQRPHIDSSPPRSWSNSAGLEMSWSVWDGGRRQASEALEKLTLTKAEQQVILSTNDALRKTAEAYYGLHKALLAKRNHEEKRKLLERQKSNIEQKVKNGLAAETGLMEMEGRIQQSEAIGIVLIRRLKAAQSALINAMGTDGINGMKVTDVSELTVSPLKAPPKVSWDDTTAAKILSMEDQSDRLKLSQMDAKHGPQIDLTTNVSAGVRDVGVLDDRRQGQSIGSSSLNLTFKYNLFDAGQRRHEKAAAVSFQKSQELERSQKYQEQHSAFEDLYRELDSLAAQLNADRKLFEMEKKRFDIVEREYRRGAQSYLDLVAALDALSLAQQAVDDDMIAEQLGHIRLHNLAGSIYGAVME